MKCQNAAMGDPRGSSHCFGMWLKVPPRPKLTVTAGLGTFRVFIYFRSAMVMIAKHLFFVVFQVTRDFSFLDYILGGCQLMFTVRTFTSLCPVIVTHI